MDATCTRNAKGTPAYMPPEGAMGDVSAKWDVWSFGVVWIVINSSNSHISPRIYLK